MCNLDKSIKCKINVQISVKTNKKDQIAKESFITDKMKYVVHDKSLI